MLKITKPLSAPCRREGAFEWLRRSKPAVAAREQENMGEGISRCRPLNGIAATASVPCKAPLGTPTEWQRTWHPEKRRESVFEAAENYRFSRASRSKPRLS